MSEIPNPYFINIELVWPNQTPANPNEIARVKAFDVFNGVETEQGESGYDPETGGWQPVFMQNIAGFHPPREKPNLRFVVEDTTDQVVHTTQLFQEISSGATVRIVIGQSDWISDGGGGGPEPGNTWHVSGQVRYPDGIPFTAGVVRVFDVTAESELELGAAILGPGGLYAVTYKTEDFHQNGTYHPQPNLQVRVFSMSEQLLSQSELRIAGGHNEVIDLTVSISSTRRRVFGAVRNSIELPVGGVLLEAYHVAWTADGLEEVPLGSATTDGDGVYEIFYDEPVVATPLSPCGPPAGQINLIVYAKEEEPPGGGDPELVTISSVGVIFNAAAEQEANLVVDRVASSGESEYARIDAALAGCLGEDEEARWASLNRLNERPDFLSFVAQSTGWDEVLVRSYVTSWLIAGEINAKVPASALSEPMKAEVIYALVRGGEGNSLLELLDVAPARFFEALVNAIHERTVPEALEERLRPTDEHPQTLLDDWQLVLARMMTQGGAAIPWQKRLLDLVFASFPEVASVTQTSFGTASQSHNVALPGTLDEGDLLLVLFTSRGTSTVTTPAGWTELWSESSGSGGEAVRFSGYAKVAAPGDGGSTVNFQTSASQQAAAQVYRVSKGDWRGALEGGISVAEPAVGQTVLLDPPMLSTDWGRNKALWIACAGHGNDTALAESPVSYEETQRTSSGSSTGNCTTLSARRAQEVAGVDPNPFTIASSSQWVAQTVGIHPSSSRQEAVASAHFEHVGSFEELLLGLVEDGVVTQAEAGDLEFVFEMYEAVGRYYPIVAAVFPHRAEQGLASVRDLGKVPLTGEGETLGWVDYVEEASAIGGVTEAIPAPGKALERNRIFAERLYELFGERGESERFVAGMAAYAAAHDEPELGAVAQFLADNPNFDLEHGNIDQYLADKAADDEEFDPESIPVERIKQIQRVFRLTNDFEAAAYLVDQRLDSAVKIAQVAEDEFIADHQEGVGGLTAAEKIHRIAVHYSAEVLGTIVQFHPSLTEVGGMTAVPGGVDVRVLLDPTAAYDKYLVNEDGEEDTRRFPNWITLFGDLNKSASEHCQTILGPGAYLVDLLEFVEKTLKRSVVGRRPDLLDIELTCANTNTALPYIDLGNEVLEAVIAPHEFALGLDETTLNDAVAGTGTARDELQQAFANHDYPFTDKAVVKKIGAEWVVEETSWRFTIRPVEGVLRVFGTPQTSETARDLDVYPEHFNKAAYNKLATALFPLNLPLHLGKEELDIFLTHKRIRKHEILSAFSTAEEAEKLTDEAIALAYLNLTEGEAQAILATSGGEPAWSYWGFNADVDVEIPRPDKPTRRMIGGWVELMQQVAVFLHRTGLKYEQLLDLLDTSFIHVEADVVPDVQLPDQTTLRLVHLTGDGDDILECNYNQFQLAGLNEPTLLRISFFLRLWRRLGVSMRELDRYLMKLDGGHEDGLPSNLVKLYQVRRLSEELGIPFDSMHALWANIDTKRTERAPRSFFDEVFLVGDPNSAEYKALDRVARTGDLIDLQGSAGVDFRSHLSSALEIKSSAMDRLWEEVIGGGTDLGLAQLSEMFRVVTLCQALGLAVSEYYDLKLLLGVEPFTGDVLDTFAAVREIRRAQKVGLAADQVAYVLRHQFEAGDPFAPTQDDLDDAVRRLAAAATSIKEAYPDQLAPDAAVLKDALARMMPADKVTRVIEIVQGPEAPSPEDATERRGLLERYFEPFLPEDAQERDEFLERLIDFNAQQETPEQELADRYAHVWGQLEGYLVDRAAASEALAAVSELLSVESDTASALLRRALTSVDPGLASVAETDWKRMVRGGWDTGEGTILDGSGPRHARLMVPRDGRYTFVAVVDAEQGEHEVELSLGGESLDHGSPTVVSGRTEFTFASQDLRAGAVLPILVNYQGESKVTLSWRIDNDDAAVVPVTALVPFREEVYLKAFKAAQLVRALRLTRVELDYLIDGENVDLDIDELPLAKEVDPEEWVAWDDLASFVDLLSLQRSIAFKSGSVFELWREVEASDPLTLDPVEMAEELARRTGWRAEDVTTLRALFGDLEEPEARWQHPKLWSVLRAGMDVVRRLDLPAERIRALLVEAEPSIEVANVVRNAYRPRFSRDAWKDTFKPLRDHLRQRQRDALVGYLTSHPVPITGQEQPKHFFDANDLYAFYLIDVQNEPDVLISRIRLALNAVQLLVERTFLGLEADISLDETALEEARAQWEWMRNYRVWEANRKVFLYPENWIEPELRDDKTEIFRQLEEELLQDEIDDERARTALSNYLDKLGELGNLEVIGLYAEGVFADGTNATLHVVGRTRFQPRSFYYRTFEMKQSYDGRWTPWRKVELDIDANFVAPAVFGGRLHLVWPMVQTKQKTTEGPAFADGSNAGVERAEYANQIKIVWSEYRETENKWSKPRISKEFALDYDVRSPSQRDFGEDRPRTEPYSLRVKQDEVTPDVLAVELFTYTPAHNGLGSPVLKGTFRIWRGGADTFEAAAYGTARPFGANWPQSGLLDGAATGALTAASTGTALAFLNSVEFFERAGNVRRVFSTNFGFIDAAEYQPFFYEENTKNLFALNRGPAEQPGLGGSELQRVRFSTFHHPLVQELQETFRSNGPEGLMQRLTQALPVAQNRYYPSYYYSYYGNIYLGYHIARDKNAYWTTQILFEEEYLVNRSSVTGRYPMPTIEFAYGTSMGTYNWELFFHVPVWIADRLSQELKFEEAMKWYHYVFDPRQTLNSYERIWRWARDLPAGSRYWNFLPFFANANATESLLATLGLKKSASSYQKEEMQALIDEWRRNPFNPHLIARSRIVAYQKNVVMKYLDNLIAWADQLFRQDTIESINRATQLYVLADELLGRRPEVIEPMTQAPKHTYRELKAQGIGPFGNAILEVENLMVSNQGYLKGQTLPPASPMMKQSNSLMMRMFYFQVPRNDRLERYWDTVQDRLFKIRNSMNIDGVKRTLALFDPPIDPAMLVRAAAAGIDLGSVLSQLNTPLPSYRFNVWIQKAVDLANELKSFGGALLAALEKQDAEDLSLLRQGHEIRMLELARDVRRQQVREAEENIRALELSKALAEERYEDYRSRSRENAQERTQIALTNAATVFEVAQGASHAVAGAVAPIPDGYIGMVGPFPTGLVLTRVGSALSSVATATAFAFGAAASVSRGNAAIAGIEAGIEWRWVDWKLQERLALKEMEQIEQQIVAAEVRREIAETELRNHEVQMEQAEQVREFLQEKFTNRQLYQWMVSQLSRTYQQVYKLAFDVAKRAERTMQFELGTPDLNFIQFDYRDNLRQGLLAGEKLAYDLKRMEIAYLERNKRELEITKPISLAALNADALQRLRETGSCEIELPEVLFDLDFPGQYFRRIRAVRVTIPCVTGPHTSVSAKLSLLGSAIRKESTAEAADYAYKGFDDPRFVHDLVGIQSIATSTAQEDAGLFTFDFRDERYLPFEGAGAISRWRLELPTAARQFDYHTISDVVLNVSYTAREGGGLLKMGAEKQIAEGLNRVLKVVSEEPTGLVRVFSMKQEFPDEYHRLLNLPETEEDEVEMTLEQRHFPYLIRDRGFVMTLLEGNEVDLRIQTKKGQSVSNASVGINGNVVSGISGDGVITRTLDKDSSSLLSGGAPETWALSQTGLSEDNVDDLVFVVRYTIAEAAQQ